MKLISESELRELLIASERLARLDAGGVDNWDGHYYSLCANDEFGKDFWDWVEVDVDGLLEEYPDYSLTEDNYNYDD